MKCTIDQKAIYICKMIQSIRSDGVNAARIYKNVLYLVRKNYVLSGQLDMFQTLNQPYFNENILSISKKKGVDTLAIPDTFYFNKCKITNIIVYANQKTFDNNVIQKEMPSREDYCCFCGTDCPGCFDPVHEFQLVVRMPTHMLKTY